MIKLQIDKNNVVLNIVDDTNNVLINSGTTKYIVSTDESVGIGDTVFNDGKLKSRRPGFVTVTDEQKENYLQEMISSGEYILGDDGILRNNQGIELGTYCEIPK